MIAGTSYSISRAYDNLDRQITVTYPGGTQAKFEYNDQDQVTAVKSVIGSTTTTLASQFSYLMFGPASKYTLGNGTVRQVSYDMDHRVVANSPNLTYSYNSFNEVSSITDGANSSLSQTFDYDALGRLKTVTSAAGNQAFTFDTNGSRETHTWGGVVDDYIPQATTNRIDSVTGTRSRAYTFDGRGNTYTESGWRGGYTYAYDPITNRLQTVTKASAVTQYSGNALNQRVRKAGPGGNFNFLFDSAGSLLSETVAGSTAMSTHYVWLGGELLAVIRSGVIYYVLNDQLGRPREVQNSAKTAVWRASNFAYDRSVTLNTFGGLNVGLPGQYFDTESGLYYNWNRHYDATSGRYIQPDPIGLKGGVNAYAYAAASPTNIVDPLGLAGCYVSFPGFPITIPGTSTSVPLVHAGVLSYDSAGKTRYYEYGRYNSNFGNVRRVTVPNLKMGPDGKPTPESWKKLKDELKKKGKGKTPSMSCKQDADAEKINDFAENRMNDQGREPYSWSPFNFNACTSFASDALDAGMPE